MPNHTQDQPITTMSVNRETFSCLIDKDNTPHKRSFSGLVNRDTQIRWRSSRLNVRPRQVVLLANASPDTRAASTETLSDFSSAEHHSHLTSSDQSVPPLLQSLAWDTNLLVEVATAAEADVSFMSLIQPYALCLSVGTEKDDCRLLLFRFCRCVTTLSTLQVVEATAPASKRPGKM